MVPKVEGGPGVRDVLAGHAGHLQPLIQLAKRKQTSIRCDLAAHRLQPNSLVKSQSRPLVFPFAHQVSPPSLSLNLPTRWIHAQYATKFDTRGLIPSI
jgi:hypothetical protein